MDYLALGDRHSSTSVGSTGRIWYSGSPEPTAFDEENPGNVLLVTVPAPGSIPTVSPHRVGRWTFAEQTLHLSTDADVDALTHTLAQEPHKARTALKLTLTGTLTMAQWEQLNTLLARHRDLYGALIETSDSNLSLHPENTDTDWGLDGYIASAAQELAEQAAAGERDAREALGLLLRLTRAPS